MAYLTAVSGAVALPAVVIADVALERAGLSDRYTARVGGVDVDLLVVGAKVGIGILATILVLRHMEG